MSKRFINSLHKQRFFLLEFDCMNQKTKRVLFISIPIIGLIAGYLLMGRTVPAVVNGKQMNIHTRALTVGGALRTAGVAIMEGDHITPGEREWLSRVDVIEVDQARLVHILLEPQEDMLEVNTALLIPREILEAAGVQPDPQNVVLLDGMVVSMDEPLQMRGEVVLQYRSPVQLLVNVDGVEEILTTTAIDLGTALWQAGISLREGDWLSQPLDTRLTADLEVKIRTGRDLSITVDGATIEGYSAADTVGEALAENGVALQDLDYSEPALSEALPEDGLIRVVRVTEEVLIQQTPIPYETELLADDTLELGARKVISEGAVGISANRVRVRLEDGEEVSRVNEGSIIIAQPVTRVVHYGSKIVDMVMNTPDGPITYYMAVDVVATSYSPCRSGVEGKCYTGTSYGLPVQKGVIGVHRDWYYLFKGTQIYVPGYGVGTIADIGYYPYSDYWIDLGYSDDDYVSWGATNLTIYFLSPAPPGFTGVLP